MVQETGSVHVVILNWNGWRDTVQCVRSVQAVDYPALRVLVVDNGSDDDSEQQIRRHFPGLEVLQTGANLGFGGGCNHGIRHAMQGGAQYVWLVNSDCVVEPGALSAMLQCAERDAQVAAVGSVLLESGDPQHLQAWGGGQVNVWTGRSHHCTRPGRLDFISGASMLLRVQALEKAGLFDQDAFFMYWEDTDLSFRLRSAGWKLAVAQGSRVVHKQGASWGDGNPQRDAMFTRSGVRFLRRYAPWPLVSIVIMMAFLLAARALRRDGPAWNAVIRGWRSA
jgi:GT2 family glycosyltransferase